MLKLLIAVIVAAVLVALGSPDPVVAGAPARQDAGAAPVAPPADATEGEPPGPSGRELLVALSWLAGEWHGRVGEQDVVSWHSGPEGGMIVMATKEVKDGELTLYDFGVISARETSITYVPYPYGKPSVPFLLTDFDPAVQRAVFVNEEHDFPKRFAWERTAGNALRITLTGDEGGEPLQVVYELALAASPAPAGAR
jgi:hypothetical protein